MNNNLEIKATKCKNPFLPGMVFKSKSHPHMNLIISSVWYIKCTYGTAQQISWELIDHKEFNDFLESKGITGDNTFPYSCFGCCNHSSMKSRLKKYNLELVGQEEYKIFQNDEVEFSAGLATPVKDKYSNLW